MKLYIAWILTLVGFFLSLYFEEWSDHQPCKLCWVQRIALFPLVLQLGIATAQRDQRAAFLYCFPLALFGFVIALVQSLFPNRLTSCGCGSAASPMVFDCIPLPWVSALGFFVIAFLLTICRFSRSSEF